jgi:hypothetical protein
MPEEQKQFYKVLSHRKYWSTERDFTKLYSSYIHHYVLEAFITEYKVGEWTYPKVESSLGLFVFDDLLSAQRHMQSTKADIIYFCEVKNPKRYYNALIIGAHFNKLTYIEEMKGAREKLNLAMGRYIVNKEDRDLWTSVVGNVYGCDAVKVIKAVEVSPVYKMRGF